MPIWPSTNGVRGAPSVIGRQKHSFYAVFLAIEYKLTGVSLKVSYIVWICPANRSQ